MGESITNLFIFAASRPEKSNHSQPSRLRQNAIPACGSFNGTWRPIPGEWPIPGDISTKVVHPSNRTGSTCAVACEDGYHSSWAPHPPHPQAPKRKPGSDTRRVIFIVAASLIGVAVIMCVQRSLYVAICLV